MNGMIQPIPTAELYTYNYTNGSGCASTDTLHLTINNSTYAELFESGCDSLVINGQTYNSGGLYFQLLTNAAGCDSTLALFLDINYSTHNVYSETACDSYYWNDDGNYYYSSGTYTYYYINGSGCASTDTLYLTINNSSEAEVFESGCDSLVINGQTYTTGGIYFSH